MEICIDFDGTLTTHDYPYIGKDIGAVPVLKKLIDKGHKLILFTMRSGLQLQDAVNWCKQNEIILYGINTNPTQHLWTKSPKAYGQLYIDDAALGIPLKNSLNNIDHEERLFVDWDKVEELLIEKEIL